MKRNLLTFIALLITTGIASAQEASASKTFWQDPFNSPMLPFYGVMALLVMVVLLTALVGFYVVKVLRLLITQAEKERAEKLGINYVPEPSWWDRFAQQMNASVPVSEEKQIELDHNYDGIKELDNHLPPWWKWLFYGTIGWSLVYLVVFHISSSLPLSLGEYENEVAAAEEQVRQLKASQPQVSIDESTLVYAKDESIIQKGKAVFVSNNCGSCHRNDGGGNAIGPNLTDEYWIHGGNIKSVFGTIKNGVVEKGMPAWGKVMSPQDVRDVTFFILSLQGTNPANAKAPQGAMEKMETVEAVKSDTTKISSLR